LLLNNLIFILIIILITALLSSSHRIHFASFAIVYKPAHRIMQSLAKQLVNMTTSAPSKVAPKASSEASAQTVYLLPLTDSGAPDVPGSYIYLPPPTQDAYSVRFQIQGTSSICRHGSLWVNIPAKGERFQRSKYTEYK
jgi:glycogen debranching enzyme